MKHLLQRFLLWALSKSGWKPQATIFFSPGERQVVTVHKDFSGNAHQRRIMRRAARQAYGK